MGPIPPGNALGPSIVKRRRPSMDTPDEIVRLLRAPTALSPAGSIRPVMDTMLLGLINATGKRSADAPAWQLDDETTDRC